VRRRLTQVKGIGAHEFKEVKIEHRVKALVVLNLQSYGGGRDVFGLGSSPDSLARKGFQVPIFNDGNLEVSTRCPAGESGASARCNAAATCTSGNRHVEHSIMPTM